MVLAAHASISDRRALLLAVVLLTTVSVSAAAQTRPPREAARLIATGEAALDDQRFGDALEAFAAAAKLMPGDASLQLGAGFAAAMLGQMREARTWLERAVQLDPRFTEASTLLGQVLYREGKVAEAVTVYEAALKYAPTDKGLNRLLEQWRKESQLHGRFSEAKGAHFTVMFEGPADDFAARRIVDLLERAYQRIGGILSVYPAETITVVLYTTQQFRDTTRSPEWAAGVYDGRIKIPIGGGLDDTETLRRLLDHEFVHALIATLAGPTVPVWLNEGLAASLEPDGIGWTDAALAAESRRVPFARLERSFFGLSSAQATIAYAQSARAVKRMMDLRGTSAVVSLLRALGRGTPFAAAFQQSIYMRYEDFIATVAVD